MQCKSSKKAQWTMQRSKPVLWVPNLHRAGPSFFPHYSFFFFLPFPFASFLSSLSPWRHHARCLILAQRVVVSFTPCWSAYFGYATCFGNSRHLLPRYNAQLSSERISKSGKWASLYRLQRSERSILNNRSSMRTSKWPIWGEKWVTMNNNW